MGHAQPIARLDFGAYLDWERDQADKHEFVEGEVFAMGGARRAHVTVAGNLFSALKSHLRGGPYRAYVSDMKLRIAEADAGFYPDVMVSCDARDHAAEQYLQHSTLIVEVLSDGTAAFDRGGKFAAYRRLESLREYVIVDIDARRVESFRRDATGHWVLHEFAGDGNCEFESVRFAMPLAAVFEDADPPAEANAPA
ncbi:MAG: Uma2 family endonuclease [Burkholderiales bacterium]